MIPKKYLYPEILTYKSVYLTRYNHLGIIMNERIAIILIFLFGTQIVLSQGVNSPNYGTKL